MRRDGRVSLERTGGERQIVLPIVTVSEANVRDVQE